MLQPSQGSIAVAACVLRTDRMLAGIRRCRQLARTSGAEPMQFAAINWSGDMQQGKPPTQRDPFAALRFRSASAPLRRRVFIIHFPASHCAGIRVTLPASHARSAPDALHAGFSALPSAVVAGALARSGPGRRTHAAPVRAGGHARAAPLRPGLAHRRAGGDGGAVAYRADRAGHQPRLLRPLEYRIRQSGRASAGRLGNPAAGRRRSGRRRDGTLGIARDPRPRHSRSDGTGAAQREPHSAADDLAQAGVLGGGDRYRWTVRRGRTDHRHRRRARLAARAAAAGHS
ncbi:hypothetical protein XTPLMG730_2078 [Xanthomonas translucens pv. phlei]|uniref:Uncharacterized protein n=1 Tax=Xanthomonas graminis pv. phlei TaxID=487906 RepID=A0A0K2ZY87_9XANT|nr:hypothetical protein XTPLMG730_2078 [Xanthomonas translucens pv. phlei]